MPIISTFFGIIIRMFYREHGPPYFHAEYQGQYAKFGLDGKLMAGNIRSKTALRLIREWASIHRGELDANWEKAKAGRPLDRIEPLN